MEIMLALMTFSCWSAVKQPFTYFCSSLLWRFVMIGTVFSASFVSEIQSIVTEIYGEHFDQLISYVFKGHLTPSFNLLLYRALYNRGTVDMFTYLELLRIWNFGDDAIQNQSSERSTITDYQISHWFWVTFMPAILLHHGQYIPICLSDPFVYLCHVVYRGQTVQNRPIYSVLNSTMNVGSVVTILNL